jgi:beta-glucosidase-like glycosyl hydrolase
VTALPCATPLLARRPAARPRRAHSWWSEATHGISHVSYSSKLPAASNTALPITTSCSFNRTLWTKTGNQIAREGRAFYNNGQAYQTFWTPVINIVRGAFVWQRSASEGLIVVCAVL